jgi:hypothetical protein
MNGKNTENKVEEATPPENKNNSGGSLKKNWLTIALLIFAVVIVCAIGYGLYASGGQFLLQLQKTDVSRGLITFLVAVITVSIALLLVVWVLASNLPDEKFKTRITSAKEILSTLVGILGTILGFYFGSADKDIDKELLLSKLKFKNNEVVIHASGGTSPYRFSTNLPGFDPEQTEVSDDGWWFVPIPDELETGSSVTVQVTDSKDQTISRTDKYNQVTDSEDQTTPHTDNNNPD